MSDPITSHAPPRTGPPAEPPSSTHAAWVEVDLDALVGNASALSQALPPRTRLGILVKANAYGHGMEMAARAALEGGADQLIVATIDEALALRATGIVAPILVAYPILPDAIASAVEHDIEISVGGVESVRQLLAAWHQALRPAIEGGPRVHIEVDTGMGRGGVAPADLLEVASSLDKVPGAHLSGIWSHLADGSDAGASARQARAFEAALSALAAGGRQLPPRHLAATEGLMRATVPAYDMVRIGLAYYGELGVGVTPAREMAALAAQLRPGMSVICRAVRVEWIAAGATVGYGSEWSASRRSLIATLPIGYADGWVRAYWPGAQALFRGHRVPLVGRVSMDSVCADVTDLATGGEVGPDERFVLLGAQGNERITAAELAIRRNTITNEILCSFGPRLPRIYARSSGSSPAPPTGRGDRARA